MTDDKIKTRIKHEKENINASFYGIADVIEPRKHESFEDSEGRAHSARNSVEEILHFYHIPHSGDNVYTEDVNTQLDRLLRPAGFMRRTITLGTTWWKDCKSAMICETTDGDTVALIPRHFGGYTFYDYSSGKRVNVNEESAKKLTPNALMFYEPLPNSNINRKTLLRFVRNLANNADIFWYVLLAILITAFSLFLPIVNRFIFSAIIPSGEQSLIVAIAILLLGITTSMGIISYCRKIMHSRIINSVSTTFQSAVMAKLVNLPAPFFSRYSAGELTKIVDNLNTIPGTYLDNILGSGITALFSLTYIYQIQHFAKPLIIPAIIILLCQLAISLVCIYTERKVQSANLAVSSKLFALIYSFLSGIQKLKTTGGENRAFTKWANLYKAKSSYEFTPPLIMRLTRSILSVITLSGSLLLYFVAAKNHLSSADFIAFNISYAMVSSAFISLVGMAESFSQIIPIIEQATPFLEAKPSISIDKQFVEHIDGKIEVNNVSFTYPGQSQKILDNISFTIEQGQYVAIVGKTGCGKSTLIRLLLGFDIPQSGAIYLDGKDIGNLDMPSLRSHIGAVLQNGRLFSGDIYSNITIAYPTATEEQVWAAAEIAGIADDIRALPMGLYTHISEGSGSISGGQKQRIMIARALIGKPSLIIFDEAMSALDYLTQKQVSQSVEKLPCTRIIIAHRLSTIRWCDKIIVLDKGTVAEEGTFDELAKKEGLFASLIKRQE